MAKDRIEPCIFYKSENNKCKKDRIACHRKYCQKCNLYEPREFRKNSKRYKKRDIEKMKDMNNKVKDFIYSNYIEDEI